MNRNLRHLSRRHFVTAAGTGALGLTGLVQASAQAASKHNDDARTTAIRAGAAVGEITPALGVSLDGYFMKNGPAIDVHDDLLAQCLVLDDGTERVAIVLCDMTVIPGDVFDRAKELAHRKTGLPADRMLMAATHTHSAPRVGLVQDGPSRRHVELIVRGIAEAVAEAIDNLAPAKVGYGKGQKPEYTFNRRWWMKPGTVPADPFGQRTDRVRMNPPRASEYLVKPAGPVDPEVSVVSVRHADGRPLAVLANYSFHYAGGAVRGHVSADYFGVCAGRIAELLGAGNVDPPFVGMMSNGTSGDIGGGRDFRKPGSRKPPWTWMHEVGQSLAEEVHRVTGQIDHSDRLTLSMRQTQIELGIRRPDKKRFQWAKDVLAGTWDGPKHRWTENYAREALMLDQYPPYDSHFIPILL